MIGGGTLLIFGLIFLGIVFVRFLRPGEMKYFNMLEVFKQIPAVAKKYKWHMLFFAVIYFEKNYIDKLNDPIRYNLGLDFTQYFYFLEKDFIHIVQEAFNQPHFTYVVGSLYLFAYIFINYFSVTFFAFLDRKHLANKMVMNYMMIYFISIPFYLFTPVDVTGQVHPKMDTLLYNLSPFYHQFFVNVDPFDNCMPSLHIAIPLGFLLLLWRHHRRQGFMEYKRMFWFLVGLNLFFTFAIIYLGIHWYMDIIGGILISLLGVFLVEKIEPTIWKKIDRIEPDLRTYLKMVQPRNGRKWFTLRRGAAFFVDLAIIVIPSLLIFGIPDTYWIPDEPALAVMLVWALIYWSLTEFLFHTSAGKWLFRIRIVDSFNTPYEKLPKCLKEVYGEITPEVKKEAAIDDSKYLFGIIIDIILVFVPVFLVLGRIPGLNDNILFDFVIAGSVFTTYYFITRLVMGIGVGEILVDRVLSSLSSENQRRYGHAFSHARRTVFKTFTFLVLVDMISDFLIKLFFRGEDYHIHKKHSEDFIHPKNRGVKKK